MAKKEWERLNPPTYKTIEEIKNLTEADLIIEGEIPEMKL